MKHPLNLLNQKFYNQIADHFHQTRLKPWQGWIDLLPFFTNFFADIINKNSQVDVLDIGCGNGRFANFLEKNLLNDLKSNLESNLDLDYAQNLNFIGLDTDQALLDYAKKLKLSFKNNWQKRDVFEDFSKSNFSQSESESQDESETKNLDQKKVDLCVAFGVIHHLPKELRISFFQNIAKKLKPNGVAIITAWRFDKSKRFAKSIIRPESDEMKKIEKEFDFKPEDLGESDFLIDWETGLRAVRFVHIWDEIEMQNVCKEVGLKIVNSFDQDGKEGDLNTYYILGLQK